MIPSSIIMLKSIKANVLFFDSPLIWSGMYLITNSW